MLHTLHRLHRPPHLTLVLQEEHDAPALFSLIQQEKARLRHTLAWPDRVQHVEDTLTTIRKNRADFFCRTLSGLSNPLAGRNGRYGIL